MDQNLNNSQNEFLWKLLANPADEAHLYGFNLQRLVNDFPQSGLLQALLAHASDEKNLKQASVYFNARSLYKLINAPATFADVPAEKIFVQNNIGSANHSSYEDQQQFIDSYTAEHDKHAASESSLVDSADIKDGAVTKQGHYKPVENSEPETADHLAEPLTAQIEDSKPLEHTETFETNEESTEPAYGKIEEPEVSELADTEAVAGALDVGPQQEKPVAEEIQHTSIEAAKGEEGISRDVSSEGLYHTFTNEEQQTTDVEGKADPETGYHDNVKSDVAGDVLDDAAITKDNLAVPVSETQPSKEEMDGSVNDAEPVAVQPSANNLEMPHVAEQAAVPLRTEASLTLEERLERILNEARGIPNAPLIPLNQIVEPPVADAEAINAKHEGEASVESSDATVVEEVEKDSESGVVRQEFEPSSVDEHQITEGALEERKVAEIANEDENVDPAIQEIIDQAPVTSVDQDPNALAHNSHKEEFEDADESTVVNEHSDKPADEQQVAAAVAEQHPESIIEQMFARAPETSHETFETHPHGEATASNIEPQPVESSKQSTPFEIVTEDAYSVLPATEAEASDPSPSDMEDVKAEDYNNGHAQSDHNEEQSAGSHVEEPEAEQLDQQPAIERGATVSEHADATATSQNTQPVLSEQTEPSAEPALIAPRQDIEDEVFDEIMGIEQIMSRSPEEETDRLIRGSAVGSDYLSFDRKFGERNNSEEPIAHQPVANESATEEAEKQDVSNYHDEKMPYSFMWWLNKTRKEHAAMYQPFAKPDVVQSIAKAKNSGDELQQQYYENIFHITSVEELDKSVPAPAKVFEFGVKRREQAIIERFIEEEPTIKPQSSDKIDNENKAKKSSEDRDEMVTETLAGIYAEQMLYHKAIASYRKLMLKFPEKSRYFAGKIEQIEKKTS